MKQIQTFKFLSHHYCCCCLAVVCLLLMTSNAASYSCDGAAPGCSYKPAPRGGARGALNVYKPDNTWSPWDLLRPVQWTEWPESLIDIITVRQKLLESVSWLSMCSSVGLLSLTTQLRPAGSKTTEAQKSFKDFRIQCTCKKYPESYLGNVVVHE